MNNVNPSWGLQASTGLAAGILSLCSVTLSISFGVMLGSSVIFSIIFALLLGGVAIGEFISAGHLSLAIKNRDTPSLAGALWLLIGGVIVSILAGQSALQQSVDEAMSERRMQSDVYQSAIREREVAKKKVADLIVSENQATQATKLLNSLQAEKSTYLASPAKNSREQRAGTIGTRVGDCTGTSYYVSKYCGKIRTINSQIVNHQGILNRYATYQNANSHLDKIMSTPLPKATADATLPGIAALSLVLGLDPERAGANIFLFLAVFCEISAIILWYLWGRTRNVQPMSFSPEYNVAPQIAVEGGKSLSYNTLSSQPVGSPFDSLFGEASQMVASGVLAPSKYGLQKWSKSLGSLLPDGIIKMWQQTWLAQNLIESSTAQNGKNTYKLKTG